MLPPREYPNWLTVPTPAAAVKLSGKNEGEGLATETPQAHQSRKCSRKLEKDDGGVGFPVVLREHQVRQRDDGRFSLLLPRSSPPIRKPHLVQQRPIRFSLSDSNRTGKKYRYIKDWISFFVCFFVCRLIFMDGSKPSMLIRRSVTPLPLSGKPQQVQS